MGAQQAAVLRLVLRRDITLTFAALAVGCPPHGMLTKIASAFLYGTSPHDAITLILVPIMLILVALVAAWDPSPDAPRRTIPPVHYAWNKGKPDEDAINSGAANPTLSPDCHLHPQSGSDRLVPRNHTLPLFAESFNSQPDYITVAQINRRLLPKAHARWCPCRNHISRIQSHELAQIAD
jgi:hypothetical protein